jgi:hexulose-6-phosphate isomerase
VSRRDFLSRTTGLAAVTGLAALTGQSTARAADPGFATTLRKALIVDHPTAERLKPLKDAGFEGVEAGVQSVAEAAKAREAAASLGMTIHSVLRGWAEFNSPDPAKVEATFKTTEDALRAAQAYGAAAVLLVPCRIGGMKMPQPWEFHLDFDDTTGRLRKVVVGDNAPYQAYIEAHNHAIDTSREAVKRLIPLAEKTGVVIALENVWNNLWVRPDHFRQFVASFANPWVKAYFDIGNHVKYAPSEQWILTLGSLIAKVHVKDFKLSASDPAGGGDFVNIRDGSVRWPVIRAALDRVGYNGWLTIEGGDLSLEEHNRRLSLILTGK